MKIHGLLCAAMLLGSGVAHAAKSWDTATLTDVRPLAPPSNAKKENKHQQYDLVVTDKGETYTCRYDGKGSFKPTEFPVGSNVRFQLNGQKGEVKNERGDSSAKCKIVRVEVAKQQP
jgi:hypothetical protein